MILKQLKQLALSAPLRNARLARFYGSPALCESLTTSKVRTRLSRDDRRALVESFVNEYRETNAGKFPTLQTIHKEVGGNYYVVRDIFQELKLKPKASVPIVAKALSEVSAPVPIVAKALSEVPAPVPIDASLQAINDSQSHSSACNEHVIVFQVGSPDTIETESDQRLAAVDSSHPSSEKSNLQGNNLVITATHDKRETDEAPNSDVESKWDSSTHPNSNFEESNLQGNNLAITATDEKRETEIAPNSDVESKWDSSTHPNSEESNLQGNNLVIPATDDKRKTEIAPNSDVESKWDSSTHPNSDENDLQGNNLVIPATDDKREAEIAPNSDVDSKLDSNTHEEEENLTHSGSQESKEDHLEGAAVSANGVPTENRQVTVRGAGKVKTEEKSGAWSNIMSFAKEFANFWRKG